MLTPQYFRGHHHLRRYYFFFLICLSFTLGVFLSADLKTTFLFFELMSLGSYVWVVQEETPEAFREKAEIFFRDLLRQLHHITEGGHEQ